MKKKVKRFLKRNCITIPFYLAVIGMVGTAFYIDRPESTGDYVIPPRIYEVWAAEEYPEIEEEEPSAEEMIIAACNKYGIPHDIPLAIAKLETGNFTSDAYVYGNNVGGMSVNEVPLTYETLSEGVDAFVKNLTENYFNIGLTTPEEIGAKYCPINEATWVSTVKELM